MWLRMPASPSGVVTPYYDSVLQLLWKDRKMSIQTFGKQPDRIVVPYDKDQLTHLQQYNDDWTLFLLSSKAQIDSQYPQHALLSLFKNHPVNFPLWCILSLLLE